jgi:sporulation protein YlmC with PRC-barrel domain
MMLLSDLLEAEVETEDGKALGRVHDVRARVLERRGSEGYQLRVVGLVIGGRGVRERLGLEVGRGEDPIAERDVIEWEFVRSVEGDAGRVVVSRDAA